MNIHEKAAAGFARAADTYERGRPDYPAAAIEFLAENMPIEEGVKVLDLAAGTGKLTALIAPLGADIVAVEPVREMREKLKANCPDAEVLEGVAEKIPLKDGSVDVVLVAQAFHWFKGPQALKEIYRVLKADGILALVYNVRDERLPWVEEMTKLIDAQRGQTPQYRSMEWKKAFDETDLFSTLSVERFPHVQVGDLETFVDRAASISYISALPDAEREAFLAKIRELVMAANPGKSEIRMPYITHVYWCEKI